jgi:hypothetical protein
MEIRKYMFELRTYTNLENTHFRNYLLILFISIYLMANI